MQSVSTTTKLRQKFYAQVQRRSFHTAWVKAGHCLLSTPRRLLPPKADTWTRYARALLLTPYWAFRIEFQFLRMNQAVRTLIAPEN